MKKEFECYFCKKRFTDWIANRPCERVFCSRKCKADFMRTQKGNQTPHWKDAKSNHSQGYLVITRKGEQYLEHRYIMEQHLGRTLERDEHVHHINGNKQDNNLDNLQLLINTEHEALHLKGNKRAQKYFPQKYVNRKRMYA